MIQKVTCNRLKMQHRCMQIRVVIFDLQVYKTTVNIESYSCIYVLKTTTVHKNWLHLHST